MGAGGGDILDNAIVLSNLSASIRAFYHDRCGDMRKREMANKSNPARGGTKANRPCAAGGKTTLLFGGSVPVWIMMTLPWLISLSPPRPTCLSLA